MQRFWIIMLFFIGAMLVLPTPSTTHAQHRNNLLKCEFSSGPYAGQDIFLRYEGDTQRVTLVSWQTGETIQVLDENIATTQLDVRTWLDNCKYIVISLNPLGEQITIAYNVQENRRIGEIVTNTHSYAGGGTSSTGLQDTILIQSTSGAYLWNLITNERVVFDLPANGLGINLYRLQIDVERGWMRFETPSDPGTLFIYDYRSGQQLAQFRNGPNAAEVNSVVLGNGWEAIIGGSLTPDYAVGSFSSHLIATLWSYDTLESIQLYRVFRGLGRIYFSPSGRYMVIHGSFIQVYDLTQAQPLSPFVEVDTRNELGSRPNDLRFSDDETELQYLYYAQNSAFDQFAPLEVRWVRLARFDIPTSTIVANNYYDADICYNSEWLGDDIPADMYSWACASVPE